MHYTYTAVITPGEGKYYACVPDIPGCITTGHQVQLITPTARRQAFALEIDDDFNLVVGLYNDKRETISAGEVSVRGMYGYV